MTYGGLPQVVLAETEREKSSILDELFEKTYLKDVMERHKMWLFEFSCQKTHRCSPHLM